MKYTKLFKDLNKNSADIAGGKGASLGEMLNAGIPVPDGYVILSTTFDEFLHKADLIQEVDAILESVDHKVIHTIDSASEKIQELIKHAQMPADIAAEIESQFTVLDAEFVAVRSSATAEDGADNAWAGQLESYLNTMKDSLLEKVQHCWASLFTPRAIFYRFEKGLHTTKISVAVVVQKMVNSEKSGIAFSVHPVTEDRNQLIIEAGFGLGEAIVSGSVTPDSYVVEKEPRKIIDINVSNQTRAMYRKEGGGNEWIDLGENGGKQVFSEAEILEFSEIVLTIENHYGFPCDIEWAYEGGKFYITQSRPITTLSDKTIELEQLSFVSPELKGFNPSDYHFDGLWKNDLFATCFWQDCWVLDVVEEMKLSLQGVGVMNLKGGHYLVNKSARIGMDKQIKQMVDERNEEFFKNLVKVSDKIFIWAVEKGESIRSKEPTLENFRDFVNTAKRLNFLWLIGATYTNWPVEEKLQEAIIEDKFPPEHALDIVPKIITPLTHYQQGLIELKKAIGEKSFEEVEKDHKLFEQLKGHAEKYVWVETFNFIGEPLTPERLYAQIEHLEHENDAHDNSFVPDKPLSLKLKFVAECMHDVGYVKQGGAEYFSIFSERTLPFLRAVAEEIGVTYREFMCLLTDEIDQALQGKLGSEELKKKATHRLGINDWAVIGGKDGKMIFIDEVIDINLLMDKMIPRTGAGTKELIGQTGNRGKYTGPARIVMNTYDFDKIKSGDVLVTTMTTPDFIVLMQKSGAIVTDIGGLLCHAAIVSRELKKPCVIGTKFATQLLKDDDIIEVDADNGVVRILNSKQNTKQIFEKVYTRDTTIIMQEAWGLCCRKYLKEEFNKENPYHPEIIHFMNQGSIEIWENKKATQFLMDVIFEKNKEDSNFLPIVIEKYKEQLKYFKKCWDEEYLHDLNEFDTYFNKIKEALVNFIYYYYSAVDERTPADLREVALKFRDEDLFFSTSDTFIRNTLIHHYPNIEGYETSVFSDEVNSIPDFLVLQKRRENMTLIDGLERNIQTLEDLNKRLPELEFVREDVISSGNEIKGQVAYKGLVRGTARILRRRDQIKDVKEGDIIISPMTTPDFMPAMEKAAAFVTDEGGITCHAGIVARELKKPCVIGTKVATRLIEDGDMVEVDADNGVVRILGKKEKEFDEEYFKDLTHLVSRPQSVQRDDICYVIVQKFKRMGPKTVTIPLEGKNRAIYLGKEFTKKMYEKLFNDLNSEKGFATHMKQYGIIKNDLKKLAVKLEAVKKDKINLLSSYEKFIDTTAKLADYIWSPFLIESVFDQKLFDLLSEKYPDKTEEFYHAFTSPTELHEYQKMRLMICESIIKKTPIAKATKKLSEEFVWYGEYSYVEPLFDETYFKKEIEALSIDSAKIEYEKINTELKHNQKEYKKALSKVSDSMIILYAKVVNKYVLLRTDRVDTLKKIQKSLRPIFDLTAELLAEETSRPWTREYVVKLTNEEIINYLKNNIVPDFEFITKRAENYVFVRDENKTEIITDSILIKKIVSIVSKKEETNIIKGKVAYKGAVQGKAVLVYSKDDLHKVGPESILVARTTMVEYTPAMERAKAFVTSEGGITSHAAIVARELKKPCIVGTGNCMDLIKDGDMVEVDADNGVVRIVE